MELEAYGTLGLTPMQFDGLTVPEIEAMVEAARWKEARLMKLWAQTICHLLRPYMKDTGTTIAWEVEGMLGGDPEKKILDERAKRLRNLDVITGETWRQS